MPSAPRRAVLYARVSSEEQAREGWSLPAQVRLLREHATREGLEIAREWAESESASRGTRTAFGEMLDHLRQAGAPQVLLVEKTDRLTRNWRDMVALDELRRAGLEIHSVREGMVLGPDADPSLLFAGDIWVAVARYASERLSHESRKGQKEKRLAGGWCHRAPLGYENRRDAAGRAIIAPDADRAPLVRQVAEAVAEGATLKEAAELADRLGLRSRRGSKLSTQTLGHLLRHPVLAGWIPETGSWPSAKHGRGRALPRLLEGAHEAIIPRETWRAVQAVLDTRTRGRGPRGSGHPLAGLVRCECGVLLTPQVQRGRHRRGHYVYLRCKACRYMVPERDVTEAAVARLAELEVPQAALAWLRTELDGEHVQEQRDLAATTDALRASSDRIQRRLRVAYEDRLDGRIDAETYDDLAARLRQEQDHLAEQLQTRQEQERATTDELIELWEMATQLAETYRRTDSEGRRAILASTLSDLRWSGGRHGRLEGDWIDLFGPLAQAEGFGQGVAAEGASPNPEEVLQNQEDEGSSVTPHPSWLRMRDVGHDLPGPAVRAAIAALRAA